MLYFAVGSRELDGGLMCTASHNPKAYTGAKLVRAGRSPLSGDAGIGEMSEHRRRRRTRRRPPSRAASYAEEDVIAELPATPLELHRPERGARR